MKLYNKKIIMKINFIQIIFTHKKMPHLKFSSQAPKVVELAFILGKERERQTCVKGKRKRELKK